MSIEGVEPHQLLINLLNEVHNGIFENFRKYLQENNITALNIDKKYVKKDLKNLAVALQSTHVTSVDIGYNFINSDNAIAFVKNLQNTHINCLKIYGNLIDYRGGEDFAKNLCGTKVTFVDISRNNLGPVGALNFAKNLPGTCVKEINMARNGIGPQGAEDLGAQLKNTSVESINISGNAIFNTGAMAFVKSLKGSNVMKVDMQENRIGRRCTAALCESFQGTNVISLDIQTNGIDSAGVIAFAMHLSDTNLMLVNFGKDDINVEAENFLKEALIKNQKKLMHTPYLALCFRLLPYEDRIKYLYLPALAHNASDGDQLRYALGILANPALPNELALHITSFLPAMQSPSSNNTQSQGNRYLNLAMRLHPRGINFASNQSNDQDTKVQNPRI